MKLTAILLVGLLASAPVLAQGASQYTGNEMLMDLQQRGSFMDGWWTGYIIGAADDLAAEHRLCIADGVIHRQIRDVVVKWLNDHPERLHEAPYYLSREALLKAWPCPSKGK